jgi:penicillin-binding protein 2
MVTGFAGLRSGLVSSRYWSRECTGVFDRYEHLDFIAHCWFFLRNRIGHGWTELIPALEYSCNHFFLDVGALIGDSLRFLDDDPYSETYGQMRPGTVVDGAEYIGITTVEFGLGVPTGIEINENIGVLSSPSARRERLGIAEGEDYDGAEVDARWFAADTVLTAFGQGDSRFSPLQLANFTATIANGGTLYDLTILNRILSSDFRVLHVQEPNVRHIVPGAHHLELIQEGMVAASVGRRGTAYPVFGNYPIVVASKTGTAQIEGQDTNDGAFVAFAPAGNPDIAVALVVEKGGSGSAVMDISRMIFDHHFRSESAIMSVPYGNLIP